MIRAFAQLHYISFSAMDGVELSFTFGDDGIACAHPYTGAP
jgi:hypothetical protein